MFPARPLHVLLFLTGSLSMGMEVVWTRMFTPFMGTFVYAFALILATYLVATFLGSSAYRGAARKGIAGRTGPFVWIAAGTFALLALYAGDPQNDLPWRLPDASERLFIGLAPVAAAFGFLTPMLVDRASSGDPARAGAAYAVNVVGSILGPLVACFVLLPWLGERATMIALALPLFWIALSSITHSVQPAAKTLASVALVASVAVSVWLIFGTHPYEARFQGFQIRRDATATTFATGEGRQKELYVNGISVTGLTPITKMMVHMPLAWRGKAPERVLVICFGMGTSFRSALTWGAPTTAVELVPGVAELFPYFHADAHDCLAKPGAKIVVDDGRRFLERTSERFDLIVIDPPPPVQAAASSLLYSREFYRTAKKRLKPGAILQQWLPDFDPATLLAVVLSIQAEFPYVRAFQSCEGSGLHFFASDAPLPDVTAAELARRLPPAAARDLVEWGPEPTPEKQFALVLGREAKLDPSQFPPGALPLTDDRPINEYFLLRTYRNSAAEIRPGAGTTGSASPGH
jgi:predicted membrane-bound spermidine synthase